MYQYRGRLEGKTALVTGGANGIGRSICELFAREGAQIAILDIDETGVQDTLKLIENEKNHSFIIADVTKADDVKEAFRQAEEKFGRKCDIVINNAGIPGNQLKLLSELDEQGFDRVININLKGVFLVAKEFINSVKTVDKDARGVLVNMSSICATLGVTPNGEYNAAKAGVLALTKTIANEFSTHRVRCNSVMPGPTLTPMLEKVPSDVVEPYRNIIPLQRLATPEEIAYGFLYLASDESSFVHGTHLEITGGL